MQTGENMYQGPAATEDCRPLFVGPAERAFSPPGVGDGGFRA